MSTSKGREKSFQTWHSCFRPENQLYFQKKPTLIHWLNNESHGKSERIEVNNEDILPRSMN